MNEQEKKEVRREHLRFWGFWTRMERLLGRDISYNEIHELNKITHKDEMLNENTKTEV